MFLRVLALLGAATLVVVLLISCGKKPVDTQRYAFGPASATGSLTQADTSLVRRGTHLLQMPDGSSWYLESKTENLQEYVGQTVHVEGILEPNVSDQALPVLVVNRLTGGTETLQPHEWRIPALGIVLTTPDTWKADIKNEIVTFTLTGTGDALLTITRKAGDALPQGETAYANGRRGVRVADKASGLQDVYFADGGFVIRLHFTPDAAVMTDSVQAMRMTGMFDDVIRALRWTGTGNTSAAGTATGSTAGTPCGGPAGILCPAGYYCDVFDTASNIGKCRKM